jgi:hypothetical protein
MRWDRISMLIDKMKEDLEREGYEVAICPWNSLFQLLSQIFSRRGISTLAAKIPARHSAHQLHG